MITETPAAAAALSTFRSCCERPPNWRKRADEHCLTILHMIHTCTHHATRPIRNTMIKTPSVLHKSCEDCLGCPGHRDWSSPFRAGASPRRVANVHRQLRHHHLPTLGQPRAAAAAKVGQARSGETCADKRQQLANAKHSVHTNVDRASPILIFYILQNSYQL